MLPELATEISLKPTERLEQLMVSVKLAVGKAFTVNNAVSIAETQPAAEVTVNCTVFIPPVV